MKYNTSKLTGVILDQAVAKAMGFQYDKETDRRMSCGHPGILSFFSVCLAVVDGRIRVFSPSSDWKDGGPLIERENIDIYHFGREILPSLWECAAEVNAGHRQYGETVLMAAMRCLVASKFGGEVDL